MRRRVASRLSHVQCPMSHVPFAEIHFGHWTLDVGLPWLHSQPHLPAHEYLASTLHRLESAECRSASPGENVQSSGSPSDAASSQLRPARKAPAPESVRYRQLCIPSDRESIRLSLLPVHSSAAVFRRQPTMSVRFRSRGRGRPELSPSRDRSHLLSKLKYTSQRTPRIYWSKHAHSFR